MRGVSQIGVFMKNKLFPLLIVVLALGFALASCKDDGGSAPSHVAYIGTWLYDGGIDDTTITITENRFELTSTNGSSITFDIVSWTPVTTVASGNTYPTNHSYLSNYPSGFTLGVSNVLVIGSSFVTTDSVTVYLHSDGNSIRRWSKATSSPNNLSYVKQ
jgi:hypothetical protein